jgi:broad specificity phosphatase PhoE
MGFAVNEQLEVLGDFPQEVLDEIGHQERWKWPQPFVAFAEYVVHGGPTARMAQRQRAAWLLALESIPDGGSALIVSHGRVIEAGLVACVPDGDFAAWGPSFRHGEGVKLTYQGGCFGNVKFRRNLDPGQIDGSRFA